MSRFFLPFIFCLVFSNAVVAGNKVNRIILKESAAKELGFKISKNVFLNLPSLGRTSLKLEFPNKVDQARWVQVTVAMYQNNKYLSSVSQTAPNSENRIFYTYNPKLIDEIKVSVHYSDSRVYEVTYGVSVSNSIVAHDIDKPPELWSWFKDIEKPKAACLTQSFLALSEVGLKDTTQNEYGFYGSIENNRIVVKCLSTDSNRSKVMVAVAGKNRKSVEFLRNSIIKLIK